MKFPTITQSVDFPNLWERNKSASTGNNCGRGRLGRGRGGNSYVAGLVARSGAPCQIRGQGGLGWSAGISSSTDQPTLLIDPDPPVAANLEHPDEEDGLRRMTGETMDTNEEMTYSTQSICAYAVTDETASNTAHKGVGSQPHQSNHSPVRII
ncbi:hypothetical protein M9H77_02018 [Catharanthus roseus]|uniref:Uncharacterized protein n=1 Tax=Catharanthus roseus TaxID=4058 RepID=A0ACC0C774_CATRO|nr:hypothetical protein M9H77_02018 [Catharanthus roseus]